MGVAIASVTTGKSVEGEDGKTREGLNGSVEGSRIKRGILSGARNFLDFFQDQDLTGLRIESRFTEKNNKPSLCERGKTPKAHEVERGNEPPMASFNRERVYNVSLDQESEAVPE
jgi:hypothetical protein